MSVEAGDGGTPSGAPPELPSLPRRLVDVFVSPGDLFEALRERPVWIGALLLGAGLVLVSFLVLPSEVYVEMARGQMQQMGEQGGGESPLDVETMGTIMKFAGSAGALISWFVVAAILAGVMTLVFGFMLGDEGRFKQYLSVAAHGLLISAVASVLLIPLRIFQGDLQATLSVGTFAPFLEDDSMLAMTLQGLDLFALWAFVVMAIGVSKMDPERGVLGPTAVLWSLAVVMAVAGALIASAVGA